MWVIATSDGYAVQFELYQGMKKTDGMRRSTTSWGLAEHVVLDLLQSFQEACRTMSLLTIFSLVLNACEARL